MAEAGTDKIKVRTVLADAHPVVRAGLRAIFLARWPRISVIGEAGDGRELVSMVQSLEPDLVILDVSMPELNGIDAARTVREMRPATHILICSGHASEVAVLESISVGVNGYVLKDATPDELERAARTVVAGRTYFSPAIASVLAVSLGHRGKRGIRLSPREREVVQLVSEGQRLADIAKRLFVSPQTVKSHRANAMRKLELGTTAELVRYALTHGIGHA
jgi:DNA-binding NarL/FixJ family response regulator